MLTELRNFLRKPKFLKKLRSEPNIILVANMLAVVLALVIGLPIRLSSHLPSPRTVMLVRFPGHIYINLLKFNIIPLIASNFIVGVGTASIKRVRWVFLFSFNWFLLTSCLAAFVGISLAVLIQPGVVTMQGLISPQSVPHEFKQPLDGFFDLVRNFFPPNMVQIALESSFSKTTLLNDTVGYKKVLSPNGTLIGLTPILQVREHQMIIWQKKPNMLGLISMSILIGVVLNRLGPAVKKLIDVITGINRMALELMRMIVWVSPIGILFLLLGFIIDNTAIRDASAIGWFVLTVFAGLLIHLVLFDMFPFLIFMRKNPLTHLYHMLPAIFMAIVTSSGAATVTTNVRCIAKMGYKLKDIKLVLPLGVILNMDGFVIYECISAIFLAQMSNIILTPLNFFEIALTAITLSMATGALPSTGFVNTLVILNVIGIPSDNIMLLLSVDLILDRFRTALNMLGDGITFRIAYKLLPLKVWETNDVTVNKSEKNKSLQEILANSKTEPTPKTVEDNFIDSDDSDVLPESETDNRFTKAPDQSTFSKCDKTKAFRSIAKSDINSLNIISLQRQSNRATDTASSSSDLVSSYNYGKQSAYSTSQECSTYGFHHNSQSNLIADPNIRIMAKCMALNVNEIKENSKKQENKILHIKSMGLTPQSDKNELSKDKNTSMEKIESDVVEPSLCENNVKSSNNKFYITSIHDDDV